jgi:hypothetical protein
MFRYDKIKGNHTMKVSNLCAGDFYIWQDGEKSHYQGNQIMCVRYLHYDMTKGKHTVKVTKLCEWDFLCVLRRTFFYSSTVSAVSVMAEIKPPNIAVYNWHLSPTYDMKGNQTTSVNNHVWEIFICDKIKGNHCEGNQVCVREIFIYDKMEGYHTTR